MQYSRNLTPKVITQKDLDKVGLSDMFMFLGRPRNLGSSINFGNKTINGSYQGQLTYLNTDNEIITRPNSILDMLEKQLKLHNLPCDSTVNKSDAEQDDLLKKSETMFALK